MNDRGIAHPPGWSQQRSGIGETLGGDPDPRGLRLEGVVEVLARLRGGGMVLVSDGPDREDEADLTMAASWVTPEAIAFMFSRVPDRQTQTLLTPWETGDGR